MSRIFNRRNKYGKYLVEAIVPGWDGGVANTPASIDGIIRTYGKRNISYTGEIRAAPPAGKVLNKQLQYQFGQSVKVVEINQVSFQTGAQYGASPGDLGPISPSVGASTVVGIVKLIGDSNPDSSDPRIWSKDSGTAANDHDYMIGFVRASGEITPRTRIRIGSSTQTAFLPGASGHDVIDDGWHLVAGSLRRPNTTQSQIAVQAIYPDGSYHVQAETPVTGAYSPRTTTNEGLFGNAVSPITNLFSGSILCVLFFEGVELSESDLRELYRNPFQVFRPQRLLVPLTAAAPEEPEQPAPEFPDTIHQLVASARQAHLPLSSARDYTPPPDVAPVDTFFSSGGIVVNR